jgi:hypothetical protein
MGAIQIRGLKTKRGNPEVSLSELAAGQIFIKSLYAYRNFAPSFTEKFTFDKE